MPESEKADQLTKKLGFYVRETIDMISSIGTNNENMTIAQRHAHTFNLPNHLI